MHLIRGLNAKGKESGQIILLSALLLPILLVFVGMGIDFGFGYLTRSQLSRAADATSLTAMRNLGQGQAKATALAQSVFSSNSFLSSQLYNTAPSATITYAVDAFGDPIVNVAATASVKTFFLRYFGLSTLTVSDASQSTRPPVILSLVLDRSGSMGGNGGATALPPSVKAFLYYFIEGTDQVSEASFASADRVDVAMTKTFQTPINDSLSAMNFAGATYAQGGLQDAQTQVQGVVPPPGAVKVVVYFTDGWANTNQDKLKCPALTLLNYGGIDLPQTGFVLLDPSTGVQKPNTFCTAATTFPAQDPALTKPKPPPQDVPLTRSNITTEGEWRAIDLANRMRAQGITVYSIGLGNNIDQTYLQQVANDPLSPTYNPNLPSGLAEFAPTASDLNTAFQTIASKILLRLTH